MIVRRLWFISLVLAWAGTARARPEYQESLARHYDAYLSTAIGQCAACHDVPAGVDDPAALEDMPPHNAFGERLMLLGAELEDQHRPADMVSRLELVADEDTDGDGLGNELELFTGRSPGHAEAGLTDAALANALATREKFRGRYAWHPLSRVTRPAIPAVATSDERPHPVDTFLAAEHEQRGLTPMREAPRPVLLRRLYLDLTGLPPTRAELAAFLADSSPGAYERVVDQLLDSPRYGERWGRHWMDVWRYSDWAGWTDGGQIRDSQPHIWRWRDWIVESLNADKGYDRMVVEMLAADELAPDDQDALRATGYLVRNYKMLSRETWMQDIVNHTAQAFLGMTLGCARCHDHKYDAISHQEYYRVRAIFEPHNVRIDALAPELDTKKVGLARAYDADLATPTYLYLRGDDRQPDKEHPLEPGVPVAWGGAFAVSPVALPATAYYPGLRTEIRSSLISAQEAAIAAHTAALASHAAGSPGGLQNELALRVKEAELTALRARIKADDAKYSQPPLADVVELSKAAAASERRANAVRTELEVLNKQQAVDSARAAVKPAEPATQEALKTAEAQLAETQKQLEAARTAVTETTEQYAPLTPVYPATSTGRRLAFARWLVEAGNPLTARVAVNHIWRRHFGQAIVPSMYDFGNNGRPPSHPALLDWLAAEFLQPRWRLQFELGGPRWVEAEQAAPAWSMKHLHRLLVTSAAYRRSSESDPQNQAIDQDNRFVWRMPVHRLEAEAVRDSVLYVAGQLDLTRGGVEIDHLQGNVPRRSLYFRHAQEKQMTMLKIFDCAAVSECYERKESIVPQQALALMNSDFVLTNARALARTLNADEAMHVDAEFVRGAFETVLARTPSLEESLACTQFLEEQTRLFPSSASPEPMVADIARCERPAAEPSLRARENLVQVLMNHNDFVTVQ